MVFGALFGVWQELLFFRGARVDGTIFAGFLNVVLGEESCLSLLSLVGIILLLAALDYCIYSFIYWGYYYYLLSCN